MKITVVGLGSKLGELTLLGVEAIKGGKQVVVKTEKTQQNEYFRQNDIITKSCDEFFENAEDFEQMDEKICQFLMGLGEGVVFCVNGDGFSDSTVQRLMQLNSDMQIVAGVSLAQGAFAQFPSSQSQTVTAYSLLQSNFVNTQMPLVVVEMDNKLLASEVKEKLSEFFSEEQEVTLVTDGKSKQVKLFELDRQKKYNHTTTVHISVSPLSERQSFQVQNIKDILQVLRGENGCAWDKAQTHLSIRQNILEEAYELVEALTNEDTENIIEELGDFLLQAYFHIAMAEESGEFCEKEVVDRLCRKLISRHSHIFGQEQAESASDALAVWESNKQKEKNTTSVGETILQLPKGMSALMRGTKVISRAAKGGYEWQDKSDVLKKLFEEVQELSIAIKDSSNIEEELGDCLFTLCDLCRVNDINAELALVASMDKFTRRFCFMEQKVMEEGLTLKTASFEKKEQYWQEAKKST